MVPTLTTLRPLAGPIPQRPVQVLELVGPAGAGKTTLARMLTRRGARMTLAPDIMLRRPGHLAVCVRGAPRWLPVLGWRRQDRRWRTWDELKSLVYLAAWPRALRHRLAHNQSVILLDQGPVFRLATLHAFGPATVRTPAGDPWWTAMVEEWARVLDLVIWLDAPNAILAQRINARDRRHAVKGKAESEASQFLDRYRASYQRVLTRLSVNGGPRIIAFDTSQVSIGHMVNAILTACNAVLDGG